MRDSGSIYLEYLLFEYEIFRHPKTSMAAPPHKTLCNLRGQWKLNKSLSDEIAPILALQGNNTLLRKAISSASVTLNIS